MQLPGRLRDTTLGDVLGTLHRSRATGGLELIECVGHDIGRRHVIQLVDGVIVGVTSDAPSTRLGGFLDLESSRVEPLLADQETEGRLGETLLARGLITHDQLRSALDRQFRCRLEGLFRLADANLRFRPPRPRIEDPTAPPPLDRVDFLHGRPRARHRAAVDPSDQESRDSTRRSRPSAHADRDPPHKKRDRRRSEALAVLGLCDGANQKQVRSAFRKLAQTLHPDRYPDATPQRRVELLKRFSELSRAFHVLAG